MPCRLKGRGVEGRTTAGTGAGQKRGVGPKDINRRIGRVSNVSIDVKDFRKEASANLRAADCTLMLHTSPILLGIIGALVGCYHAVACGLDRTIVGTAA